MTEPLFDAANDAGADSDGGRQRKLVIGAGVGVLALAAIGGYLLLSGGSSDSSVAISVPTRVAPTTVAPTPSASGSPSASSTVLPPYHGDVGSRDPFALPAAIQAANSPAAASPAAAAPAASASALPTSLTTTAIGGTTAIPGTTTIAGTPGTVVPIAPAGNNAPPLGDEFIQLLAAHHTPTGWTVDVRSARGIKKNVTPGSKNIAGTLFYFAGEDETTGSPTFVFQLGESQGGNLVPNAKETATKAHADKSTLFLHDGSVDGGIYTE